MSGLGIFAYIGAWIMLPLEPASQRRRNRGRAATTPHRDAGANRTHVAEVAEGIDQFKSALIIGVIAVLLMATFGSFAFVGLWLAGGGIWLLSQNPKPLLAQAQQAVNDALSDTPAEHKVPLTDQDRDEWRHLYEYEAERYGWPTVEPPADRVVPNSPQQRQTITRLVLSLLLVLVALGTAASAGDWWDVQMTRMLGIALCTVGAGVALGAVFRDRAKGLIPLGLLLAIALIPANVVGNSGSGFAAFSGGFGERAIAPTTVAMLQSSYELGAGELILDLSELDLDGASRSIQVSVGAGELMVMLPSDVGGSLSAEASMGEISIDLNDNQAADQQLDGVQVKTGELVLGGSNGELFLDLKASVGAVTVTQAD